MNTNYPSKDWKAWHDFMPGSTPTLHVRGTVTVPTTGYKAILVPAEPPVFNPVIYAFDLVITPPEANEIVHQTVTDLPVTYSEDTEKKYQQVQIRPEDHHVDVKIVQ